VCSLAASLARHQVLRRSGLGAHRQQGGDGGRQPVQDDDPPLLGSTEDGTGQQRGLRAAEGGEQHPRLLQVRAVLPLRPVHRSPDNTDLSREHRRVNPGAEADGVLGGQPERSGGERGRDRGVADADLAEGKQPATGASGGTTLLQQGSTSASASASA
jgi:hypothetical protein